MFPESENDKQKFNIAFKTHKGVLFIQCYDICFCQAEGRYSKIYLNNGNSILITKTLKEINDKLPCNLFHRIHKSFIINLNTIERINGKKNIVYIKGYTKQLDISRRRKKEFMRKVYDKSIVL